MSSANGYTLLAQTLLVGCGSHSAHKRTAVLILFFITLLKAIQLVTDQAAISAIATCQSSNIYLV
jgi:uncharacterized protein YcfL